MITRHCVKWQGKTIENYTIDKNGIVYSVNNGKALKQGSTNSLTVDGKRILINVAQVMSNVFLDGEKVGHVDGDSTNNNLKNLRPISELPKKETAPVKSRGRKLYHFDGEKTMIYEGITDAFDKTKIPKRTINTWATDNIHGWGWYIDGMNIPKEYNIPEKERQIPIILKRFFSVENIKFVKQYKSIREASRDKENITVGRNTILKALEEAFIVEMKGKKYVFEREDNQNITYNDKRIINTFANGVLKVDEDDNEIHYESQRDAAAAIGKKNQHILKAIRTGEKLNGATYISTGRQQIQKEIFRKAKITDSIVEEMNLQDNDGMDSFEEKKNEIINYDEFCNIENFKGYQLSRGGKLLSKRGYEMIFNGKGEYLRVGLTNNAGIRQNIRIHILVAKQFIENPYPKTFTLVNHINGNKRDNRVDNLEWIDHRGNAIHAIYRLGCKRGGRAVVKINEDGEKRIFESIIDAARDAGIKSPEYFKKYIGTDQIYRFATWSFQDEYDTDDTGNFQTLDDYPMYRIYDNGKVWSLFRGRFIALQKRKTIKEEYLSVDLINKDGISVCWRIHVLVATAFFGKSPNPDDQVNHLDNNPSNNHVDNLEWTTPSENVRHAVEHGGKNKEQIPVYQRDSETGEIIKRFVSMTKAAEALKTTKGRISNACKNRSETSNFYWDVEENKDLPLYKPILTFSAECVEIIRIARDGTETIYNSKNAAASAIGCSFASIHNACENGTEFKNYKWKYGEKKTIQVERKRPSKNCKIIRTDLKGNEKEFKTIADGARSIDENNVKNISANISAVIRNGKNGKMYGFYWKKVEIE